MAVTKEVEKAIGQYLEKVAAELAEVPNDQRDGVLGDIESHIYAALEKAGPSPTIDDLNVILAGMDPPSSYRESASGLGRGDERAAPSLCPYSLLAVVTAILGALVGAAILFVWSEVSFNETGIAAICTAGLVLPLLTTALGLMSASRIRASGGRLSGMALAVGSVVFYPLVVASSLAIGLAFAAILLLEASFGSAAVNQWQLFVNFPLLIIVFVVVGMADFRVFKKVWRWATRPVAPGEPV